MRRGSFWRFGIFVPPDFYVNVLGFQRDFGDESDGWSWLSRDNFRIGLGE